jgi:hypothetical protein
MPEMDGLQATRLIRSFENTGCWDASVKTEGNQMLANSAFSSDCAQEKKGKRVPIIAVSFILHEYRFMLNSISASALFPCYFIKFLFFFLITRSMQIKIPNAHV